MSHADYLNELLCAVSPSNGHEQLILEHAILEGQINITHDRRQDERQLRRFIESFLTHEDET